MAITKQATTVYMVRLSRLTEMPAGAKVTMHSGKGAFACLFEEGEVEVVW